MNLPRIFASAFARRVAYLLVAFILAGLGSGTARAQGKTCLTTGDQCTRAEAHAACMVEIEGWRTYVSGQGRKLANEECRHLDLTPPPNGRYTARANSVHLTNGTVYDTFNGAARLHFGCPPGRPWDDSTKKCGTGCEDAPPLGNSSWSGYNTGGQICKDECVYEGGDNSLCFEHVVDTQRYMRCTNWAANNTACSVSGPGGGFPSAPSEAPTDTDNDGTSDGNDGAPNNPGQGGGGEDGPPGEDDAGTCGGVGQPECGTPGTGSGNGNTSGGGMDCGTPPSSTGDAIAAQIAYQAWATRCAVEGLRKDMGGGDGGSGEEPGGGDAGSVEGSDSIYEGRGDTASDILDSFAAQAQQTALVGAVEAFFAAPPSGSCPVWVLPANAFFDAITFDFHCSGQFATILGYAGWVLMACVAVLAIRIAIT